MTRFGMTLSSEEHGPSALVHQSRMAEEAGFDFVSISDHYHPWVSEQGHSPFVWGVLGAVAEATASIDVAVGVTCPMVRIHPAVIAQAAATASLLLDGRFTLGVGTGEALNEHILGDRWPPPEVRREMLDEAVAVMRKLWTGDTVDHHGEHYTVENARIFDPPEAAVPVVVSGFGTAAVELAGRIGDGLWGGSPDADVIDRFTAAGGTGPRYAQLRLCWDTDAERARETLHRVWPNQGVPGQLPQDLPTWTHFEQAASVLTIDQTVGSSPCGPDPAPVIELVRSYVDAGYDHLYFHQVGQDVEGFVQFWQESLRPELAGVLSGAG